MVKRQVSYEHRETDYRPYFSNGAYKPNRTHELINVYVCHAIFLNGYKEIRAYSKKQYRDRFLNDFCKLAVINQQIYKALILANGKVRLLYQV